MMPALRLGGSSTLTVDMCSVRVTPRSWFGFGFGFGSGSGFGLGLGLRLGLGLGG